MPSSLLWVLGRVRAFSSPPQARSPCARGAPRGAPELGLQPAAPGERHRLGGAGGGSPPCGRAGAAPRRGVPRRPPPVSPPPAGSGAGPRSGGCGRSGGEGAGGAQRKRARREGGGGREGQGGQGGRTGKQRALLLSQQRSAGRVPRACSRDGAVPRCPPKQEGTNGTGTGDKSHWQGQKGSRLSPQKRAREPPAPHCPAPSCRPAGLTSSGGAPSTQLMEGQGLGHLVLPFPRSRCPHPTGDISKETSPPAKPGLLPPAGSHLHLLSTHGLGCVRSPQDPCPAHPSA